MINVTGVSESRVAPAAAYYANQKDQSIIIVSTDVRAKRLASDLSFFVQDKEIITLPEEEQFLLRYAAKNQDHMLTRLRALKALRTGQPVVVIAPASAAVKKIAPHSSFEKSSFRLRLGEEVDLDKIKGKLVALGYERRELIDARGQFSVRGGILDIYTPDGETPYRIEFFGAEVDSIRAFDIDSQRSLETLQSVEIYPAEEILSEREIFQSAEQKIGKAYREAAKKAAAPQVLCAKFYDEVKDKDDITKMQYLDINMWLMGDILLKADKTSMANSLELRVPFLDKKVMELAETIPLNCRVSTKTTKLALRKAAEKTLPKLTAEKDKLGFPVPIRVWLKEDKYYNTVKEECTAEIAEKFFNTEKLLARLDNHRAGKADNSRKIWTVYTFIIWYKQYFTEA